MRKIFTGIIFTVVLLIGGYGFAQEHVDPIIIKTIAQSSNYCITGKAVFRVVPEPYSGDTYTPTWQESTDDGETWTTIDFEDEGAELTYTSSTISGSHALTIEGLDPYAHAGYLYRCILVCDRAAAHKDTSKVFSLSCSSHARSRGNGTNEIVATNINNAQYVEGESAPVITEQTTVTRFSCNAGVVVPIQLHVTTAVNDNYTYQWQVSPVAEANWVNIYDTKTYPHYRGFTTNVLNLDSARSDIVNYRYRCVITTCGGVTTTSAEMTFICSQYARFSNNSTNEIATEDVDNDAYEDHQSAPVITDQSTVTRFTCGETVISQINLHVTTAVDDNYTYQWQVSPAAEDNWVNVYDTKTYPHYRGFTTNVLHLDSARNNIVNFKYRCVISTCNGLNLTYSEEMTFVCSQYARYSGNDVNEIATMDYLSEVYEDHEVAPVIVAQTGTPRFACSNPTARQPVTIFVTTSTDDPTYIYRWQLSLKDANNWVNVYDTKALPYYRGFTTNTLHLDSAASSITDYDFRCIVTTCSGWKADTSDIIRFTCSQYARFSGDDVNEIAMAEADNSGSFVNPESAPVITDQTIYRVFNCADAAVKSAVSLFVQTEDDDPTYRYRWQYSLYPSDNWVDIYDTKADPHYRGFTTNTLWLDSIVPAVTAYRYRCIVETCSGEYATTSDVMRFSCSGSARFAGGVAEIAAADVYNDNAGFHIEEQSPEFVSLVDDCETSTSPVKTKIFVKVVTNSAVPDLDYEWQVYIPELDAWWGIDDDKTDEHLTFRYSANKDSLYIDWSSTGVYDYDYKYRCIITDGALACASELMTHEITLGSVAVVSSLTYDAITCPKVDGYHVTLHALPYVHSTQYSMDGVNWQLDSTFNAGFGGSRTFYARRSAEDCAREISVSIPAAPSTLFYAANDSVNEGCFIEATNPKWQHILSYDSQHLLASIYTNKKDLGDINFRVFTASAQINYIDLDYTDASGEWYMNRHFRMTYSNDIALKASDGVKIRLYFTNAEFKAFMNSTARIEHFADLKLYRYTNETVLPLVNGVLTDNDRTSGTWVQETITERSETFTDGAIVTNPLDSIHYIEFTLTGGRYSEFWLTDKDFTTYTVTYNKNGNTVTGQPPVDNTAYPIYTNITLKGNTDVPVMNLTGATFLGWTTQQVTYLVNSAYLDNIVRTDPLYGFKSVGSTYKMTGNVTFYALWAIDANENGIPDYQETTYSVTYDDNGAESGNVPTDDNEYMVSSSVTVYGNAGVPALTKTGAVFLGWSPSQYLATIDSQTAEDVATFYQNGDNFTITANTTLYAVWAIDANDNGVIDYKESKLAVLYYNNKTPNQVVHTDRQYIAGNSATVMDTLDLRLAGHPLSYTGHVYLGFSTSRYTTITTQAAEDVITPLLKARGSSLDIETSDVPLYAVWAIDDNNNGVPDYREITYTVSYSNNQATSGEAPTDANTYLLGETVTVQGKNTLARSGAMFIGWTTTKYDALVTSASIETVLKSVLDFHDVASIFALPGNVILYPLWAVDANENGTRDYEESSLTYTVVFSAGDHGAVSGTLSFEATSGDYFSSVVTFPTVTPDESYEFAYWGDANNGNARVYDFPAVITSNLSYRAIFKPSAEVSTYTVTYHGNSNTDGSVPTDLNSPYSSGSVVTVLNKAAELVRTGTTFLGWSTRQYDIIRDLTTETAILNSVGFYSPTNTFYILQNTILYAVWAVDLNADGTPDYRAPYTLTYNGNYNTSGTFPVDANTYVKGTSATVLGNTGSLTRTNAVWIGWTTTRVVGIVNSSSWEDALTIYNAGDALTMNDNTTLYAVWAADENHNSTPDYEETFTISFVAGSNGTLSGLTTVSGIPYNQAWADAIAEVPTTVPNSGYVFDHWEDEEHNTVSFPAVIKKSATFYAIFVSEVTTYAVTYTSNGSTGVPPVDENLYAGGASVTVLGNVGTIGSDSLVKSNAVFLGWSTTPQSLVTTQATASGLTLYNAGDSYTISGNTTFYAVWAKDVNGPNGVTDAIPDYLQRSVVYHSNGGKGEVIDNNIYNCGTLDIALMPQGGMYYGENIFLGWCTDNNNGDIFTSEEEFETYKLTHDVLDPSEDVAEITVGHCENLQLYALWGEVEVFPIELAEFRAECADEGGVHLSWTTFTETNNDYFTLLRSEDNETFDEIGRVSGAGTANTPLTYNFVDEYAVAGKMYYYRLVQTDFEQQSEVVGNITALCDFGPEKVFTLYPNPTRDNVTVEYTAFVEEELQLSLYTATGMLMRIFNLKSVVGLNKHMLTVGDLAPGTYYLFVAGNNETYKLVIVR